MANTIDAALLDKAVFAEELINEAQHPLAPIALFTSRFDAVEVGSVNVKFPRVGTGGTETNPTDYIGGSATMDNVAVTVNEKSRPFEITNVELNNGIKLMELERAIFTEFVTDLTKEVTALMTEANFGTDATVDTSAFTVADLPKLAVGAKGAEKVCILEPAQYATVIPTNGDGLDPMKSAYGFSQGVHMVEAGLSADAQAFSGGKTAIAIAGGLPNKWTSFAAGEEHTIIPTILGLNILYRRWTDSNTGRHHGNFVCLFGASVADAGAGIVAIDQP